MLNVVNGGAHAENSLDLQEFMIVPGGAETFAEALRIARRGLPHAEGAARGARARDGVGDEGGFAPDFRSSEEAIERILEAIDSGRPRRPGGDRARPRDERVVPRRRATASRAATRRPATCVELLGRPRRALPDRLDRGRRRRGRLGGWKALTERLGDRVQLVGDDLFVTNVERLGRGIEDGVANAILIKVNQIGTLTETLDAIALARANGYGVVISHRSGETEDTTIADLAVATNAGQIKTGAPSRSDRVAKYNQLLRIEEELGAEAAYPGWAAFSGQLLGSI